MPRLGSGFALVCLCASISACGGDKSPTAPSTPPAPTPTVVSLTGTVSAQGGARLAGASVMIFDGVNVGKSVSTNTNGEYRFDGLTAGNGNLVARANGYDESRAGLAIDGTKSLNFTLRTAAAWSKTGVGNTVFDMPTWVTRVHVIGDYGGNSSNFIIRVGGRLIVNELVGTHWNQVHHEGTYLVAGGVVEIVDSTGVSWSMVEER
jgi:uncharacterized protein YegP (UPF0339 family)